MSDSEDSEDINYDKIDPKDIVQECFIDNLTEEEDKDIGFDLSLLKRDELHVNLIHFDKNMRNSENYGYYSNFKVDVVGGFQAMDDLEMFKKYLEVISKKNIPFIVISSGSSGKDVIPICKQYSFIKEVIIFCGYYDAHKHFMDDYPGFVKRVFTSIKEVYKYIKSFGPNNFKKGIKEYNESDSFIFSYEDIKMNKQLEQCPVISAYEYDKCYFLIHRAYAHFFGNMNDNSNKFFTKSNLNKIKEYINNSKAIKDSEKQDLISRFVPLEGKKNFAELAIREYTNESGFCYIFNRAMRNFEPGLISLAYYMGPFLFSVNKYVKDNPGKFAFKQDMKLFRNIQCSIYDFYLYKMNLNHIICFPSITSTSTVRDHFNPTMLAKILNKNGMNPKDLICVTMIFDYKHKSSNKSPGIIVGKNLASDGKEISKNSNENEVILFPFTFVRITNINEVKGKSNTYEIYLEIINREEYIEYTLRDNVEKRFKFSNLD